jgi:ATP-dependent DNA helicase RecG
MLAKLLPLARDDAKHLLALDPELKSPRGEAVRDLLYILGKDEAVKLYSVG